MAVNTRDKRSSAICFFAFGGLPNPAGTVDRGDRAHAAFTYRGLWEVTSAGIGRALKLWWRMASRRW